MAEKDRGSDEPSLELPSLKLPSLGFGRSRRKKAADEPRREPARAASTPEPVPEPVPDPRRTAVRAPEPATSPREKQPRARRELALPSVADRPAAALTGVLVGVLTVGLTWAGLGVCEAVRGTSSCGGPGYLLLLAIMVAMVLLGAVLLRAWGVPEPGSTSLLAVVLLAVVALLFLVGVLFHWWMILVVPACAALTFAAAQWVTATFVEPAR